LVLFPFTFWPVIQKRTYHEQESHYHRRGWRR
jgi:hypothetical protein